MVCFQVMLVKNHSIKQLNRGEKALCMYTVLIDSAGSFFSVPASRWWPRLQHICTASRSCGLTLIVRAMWMRYSQISPTCWGENRHRVCAVQVLNSCFGYTANLLWIFPIDLNEEVKICNFKFWFHWIFFPHIYIYRNKIGNKIHTLWAYTLAAIWQPIYIDTDIPSPE